MNNDKQDEAQTVIGDLLSIASYSHACIVCVLEMDKMCMNYAKTRFFDRHLSRSLVRTSSPLYRGD